MCTRYSIRHSAWQDKFVHELLGPNLPFLSAFERIGANCGMRQTDWCLLHIITAIWKSQSISSSEEQMPEKNELAQPFQHVWLRLFQLLSQINFCKFQQQLSSNYFIHTALFAERLVVKNVIISCVPRCT